MYGVLGSGYGIYGYVPTIISVYGSVCLLKKNKDLCAARIETTNLIGNIIWAEDIEDLCHKCSSLVIAQPPALQYETLLNLISERKIHNFKNIILEKPLADTPEHAKNLLDLLLQKKLNIRVGYILIHLDWFKSIDKIINDNIPAVFELDWSFHAHHLLHNLNTWKRYHSQGGGCLRLYGIHLISLLSKLGFTHILSSKLSSIDEDAPVRWEACFANSRKTVFKVMLNIRSEINKFNIKVHFNNNNLYEFDEQDIFTTKAEGKFFDRRSVYIEDLLASFGEENPTYISWYNKTNELWHDIEKVTHNELIMEAA